MVVISLLTSVLLATAAFADSSSTTQAHARRKSQPFRNAPSNDLLTDAGPSTFYSSNWSGSAWNKSEPTFTYVTGTFIAPKPQGPEGYASAWVGIDGFTCQTALLQTGINVAYFNGVTQYAAWYEWYPAPAVYFQDFTINTGDKIQASVRATSKTTGIAMVENLTTGKVAQTNVQSTSALCQRNVEWIVEDFSYVNGTTVPFTNFGTVKFETAYATTTTGARITPDGADVIILQQNKKTLTSVTEGVLTSEIKYVA